MATIQDILVQTVDPEQLKKMAKKKGIEANRKFIRLIKETIEYIEEQKPDDRLSYALGIENIINAMMASTKGWQKWCNLRQMDNMKKEELEEYYPRMKKVVIEWLKIDMEVTEAKTKQIEDDLKKESEEDKSKTRTKKKDEKLSRIYVA